MNNNKGFRKINFNESEMPLFVDYLKDMGYTFICDNDISKLVLDNSSKIVFRGSKCWLNDNPEIWECKIDIEIAPQLSYRMFRYD